ncbi:MAG TPA: NrsF family protein [bacterium]|nr:NrsF family protein [bacterium]
MKLTTSKGFPAVHGQVVERLAQSLAPVKAPMPLWFQWLCWIIGISALTVLLLSRVSLRDDMPSLSPATYDPLVALIFVGAALAAWGALEASIPAGEAKGKGKARTALLLYGLAFLLFMIFLPWNNTDNYPRHPLHLSCFVISLLVGLVAWIGLGLLIRHNAPLNAKRVGFWAGVSAFLVGLGVVTLHCGSHNIAHVCLEHFLPVLVYSWLVGWLGYRWISSWKRKPLTK